MVKLMTNLRKTHLPLPKPVHPTPIKHHAIFGLTNMQQHMLVDKRWSCDDLIDEYSGIAQLMKRHHILGQLEKKEYGKHIRQQCRHLRQQVNEGRVKLHKSLRGELERKLRLILINHKDMQRLYVKMPLHEVEENLNQKTFVMRKERDRLRCQLEKLKRTMEEKLIERSGLETRIRFQNEFILQEELAIHTLHHEVENSQSRLKAAQTINSTYKKIKQILEQDRKFHESILESLKRDMEDQQTFISHILYEGTPALLKLNELKRQSSRAEDSTRKQRHSKTLWLGELKRSSLHLKKSQNLHTRTGPVVNPKKHYVRETQSMLVLKIRLSKLEEKIKGMQQATLSSKPKYIYSTLKQQTKRNLDLSKEIALNTMASQDLKLRTPNLKCGKQLLIHNYSRISQIQQNYVDDLKVLIAREDVIEQGLLNSLKLPANVLVILRCSLWNIYDILRHVHLKREPKIKGSHYPNSYLNLPLLKYDMEMRAAPPNDFEENTLKVLSIVIHKLKKLLPVYEEVSESFLNDNKAEYCSEYLKTKQSEEFISELLPQSTTAKRLTSVELPKDDLNLPSRKYIKDLSKQIVEISARKDD